MCSCCHCPQFLSRHPARPQPPSSVCGMYEPRRTGLGRLWSLMEYKCMVSDRGGELIRLLGSLRSPSPGTAEVIKPGSAVQAVGCFRHSINVPLMDGVKSDFSQQSVGWEPAGLGSDAGRCSRAPAASADGARLINALLIKETLKAVFSTGWFSVAACLWGILHNPSFMEVRPVWFVPHQLPGMWEMID